MKAIVAKTPGGPEVLEFIDTPTPTPTDDEILIDVRAFGLNKAEIYNRQGNHGGFSNGKWALGIEAAGVVADDPTGQIAKGEKVVTAMGGMMFTRHGSYAESIAVKRSNVIPIRSDISYPLLASLPEAFLTAWGALDYNLRTRSGDSILVRGGTSSVGMAAIVYAKMQGLTVVATTRNSKNVAALEKLGADHVVIDNGSIATQVIERVPAGVDCAIELVGADTVTDTMSSVKRWGEVAFVGFLSGKPIRKQFHFMNDLPNTVKLSFFGSGLLGTPDLPLTQAPIDAIADKLHHKQIPSIASEQFGFNDIRQAHALVESNTAIGKVVVSL